MSILGKSQIQSLIEQGELVIKRSDDKPLSIGGCSLDVHLHSVKQTRYYNIIDTALSFEQNGWFEELQKYRMDNGDAVILYPNQLYLATVEECLLKVPTYLVPDCSGKSSLGRYGLEVEQTAGWGDPGFQGYFTLELTVTVPIMLYIGSPVAQIRFNVLKHYKATELLHEQRYNTKYQNQPQEPVPSQYHKNLIDMGTWN